MTSAPQATIYHAEALMWQRALRFPLKALPVAAHEHLGAIGLTKLAPLMSSLP